jgi:hypothetical protein
LSDYKWKDFFKVQDIVNHSKTGTLKAEDIILLPTKYDYGCGNNFPIDLMSFYRNDNDLQLIDKVNDFEYALSKPRRNQESYMRMFVRDPSKIEDAQHAFRKYCSKINPEWVEQMRKANQIESHQQQHEIDNLINIHGGTTVTQSYFKQQM